MALVNITSLRTARDKVIKSCSRRGQKNICAYLSKLFEKWSIDRSDITANEFCQSLAEIGLSIINRTGEATSANNPSTDVGTDFKSAISERQWERLRKLRELREKEKGREESKEKEEGALVAKRLEKVKVYRDSIKKGVISKLLTTSVSFNVNIFAVSVIHSYTYTHIYIIHMYTYGNFICQCHLNFP